MRDGFKIFDSDTHVGPYMDVLERYLSPDKGAYMAGFTGAKRSREPSERGDHDPAERIKDLDFEGVDVNLTLPSGWFGTWTAGEDVALEVAMFRAYHRWMDAYCGAYPKRLGG